VDENTLWTKHGRVGKLFAVEVVFSRVDFDIFSQFAEMME
jgi:hypothetical protein